MDARLCAIVVLQKEGRSQLRNSYTKKEKEVEEE